MDVSKRMVRSSGGSGPMDFGKGLNEFFYKGEADKPSWMSLASKDAGHTSELGPDEEKLLDDVHVRYARNCSIDSSRTYSRTCSLESQESDFDDHETETVLSVPVCCASCENKVMSLTQLEGVTSVTCDRKTEKVTVIGTARPRDILEACKKQFEQSKIWSPDDIIDDFGLPSGWQKP